MAEQVKEQKSDFLSMLLVALGASFLGDLLTKNLSGRAVIRAGEKEQVGLVMKQKNFDFSPINKP